MRRGITVLVGVCVLMVAVYFGISKWGIQHETLIPLADAFEDRRGTRVDDRRTDFGDVPGGAACGRGKAIADVVPASSETEERSWIGSMSDSIDIVGDIVSPVIDVGTIEALKN